MGEVGFSEGITTTDINPNAISSISLETKRTNDRQNIVAKELATQYNRPWKLNPSDVADFYILNELTFRRQGHIAEDNENIALLRARTKIDVIGNKVSTLLLRVSLKEANNFADDIVTSEQVDQINAEDPSLLERILPNYVDAQLTHYRNLLLQGRNNPQVFNKAHMTMGQVLERLKDFLQIKADIAKGSTYDISIIDSALKYSLNQMRHKFDMFSQDRLSSEEMLVDRVLLHDTLTILGATQMYPQWRDFAKTLKAYYFPQESNILPADMNEQNKKQFLIDRMINFAHSTGAIAEFISNDFPEMALVLTIPRLPSSNYEYLWRFASEGVKHDLIGRSRVLLEQRKIPEEGRVLKDEDIKGIIELVMEKDKNGGRNTFAEGLVFCMTDERLQVAALKALSRMQTYVLEDGALKIGEVTELAEADVLKRCEREVKKRLNKGVSNLQT